MTAGRDRAAAARARPALRGLFALLAAALLATGCGVKSSPQHPEGAGYPRQYPSLEEKKEDATGKEGAAPVSPLGFPYEYPNRPPSR